MLSCYVDDYQRQTSAGTITAYDPELIVAKLGNINLKKECFSKESDVSNSDFIFGFLPCEATEDIILAANAEKKPFAITLCGCTHFGNFGFNSFVSYDNWVNHVLWLSEETRRDDGKIELTYFDSSCDYPHPIIMKTLK